MPAAMTSPPTRSLRQVFQRALIRVGLTFGLTTGALLWGQADRPPELVSRTGGGGAVWTSVAELAEAAKTGIPRAMAQYGELQLAGDQVEKNVPSALEYLRRAAAAGEAAAIFRLGRLYDDGGILPQNRTRALAYYKAAAAGGIPEALFNLGASYASGRGVKRDYAEGLAWLILARKQGVRSDGENQLRTRIESLKRPQWIAAAEKRAPEIAKELASKTVVQWLEVADGGPAIPTTPPVVAPTLVKPTPPVIRPSVAPFGVPAPGPISPLLPGPGLPAPDPLQLPEPPAPKP